MIYWAIFSIIIGTIIGTFGAYLMKIYSFELRFRELKNPVFFIKKNYKLIWPIILSIIPTFFFFPWLKFYDISLLYPFTALNYVWAVILSNKLLKEKITFFKVLGMLLIISGVILIYLS